MFAAVLSEFLFNVTMSVFLKQGNLVGRAYLLAELSHRDEVLLLLFFSYANMLSILTRWNLPLKVEPTF